MLIELKRIDFTGSCMGFHVQRERVLGGLRIESLGCHIGFHVQMVGFHDTDRRATDGRIEENGIHWTAHGLPCAYGGVL
jgi:hypothetical protein